jgi:hypothetical protein
MNTNKQQIPQLNIDCVMRSFYPVVDVKAAEALQFYEDCADHIAYCEASGKEIGFDWWFASKCCRAKVS